MTEEFQKELKNTNKNRSDLLRKLELSKEKGLFNKDNLSAQQTIDFPKTE